MRIPAGDLAPVRRRRYGGGYGRRRRRSSVVVAVLLVALGAGGAYLLRKDDTGARQRLATASCPTPRATPSATAAPTQAPPVTAARLPAPPQVRLTVLNGTPRAMLAKRVGDLLAAQGFVVTGQANAPKALLGASTVTYGPGGAPAATVVSRWVRGSRTVASALAPKGSVQVVLGSGYTRLSTPTEVAAAGRTAAAPATASAAPSGTAASSTPVRPGCAA